MVWAATSSTRRMNAGCRNGMSVELTNATSARPLSAASPAAMPCTGPFVARAPIPTVRRSNVDPCHSRAALAVPIRDDRPPASTTPAHIATL